MGEKNLDVCLYCRLRVYGRGGESSAGDPTFFDETYLGDRRTYHSVVFA